MENQQPQKQFVTIEIEKDGKINIHSNIPDQVKVLGLLAISSASVSQIMINGIPPRKVDGEAKMMVEKPEGVKEEEAPTEKVEMDEATNREIQSNLDKE